MLQRLNLLAVPISISAAYYVAAFLLAARIFGLTHRDVFVGLFAGACGGLFVLCANFRNGITSPTLSTKTCS